MEGASVLGTWKTAHIGWRQAIRRFFLRLKARQTLTLFLSLRRTERSFTIRNTKSITIPCKRFIMTRIQDQYSPYRRSSRNAERLPSA